MMRSSWIALVLIISLTGCGYRLGNYSPNSARTISVGKVDVSTIRGEPRMAQWTAEKVRNAIAADNTLTLVNSDDADCHLDVRVRQVRSMVAGSAKLTSTDPDQRLYTTSIWRAEVTLEFRLTSKGSDVEKAPMKTVVGSAEYGDLVDVTVMRQDALRQALVNASRRLVREMLNTW